MANRAARNQQPAPHVLVFPFPAQGHINSMIKLAHLLARAGFYITFLNSQHNDAKLRQNSPDLHSRLTSSSLDNFRFRSISDGLPTDHPRTADKIEDLRMSLNKETRRLFSDMLIAERERFETVDGNGWPAMSCVIADGVMSFPMEVAAEYGIPGLLFRTVSAGSTWAYYSAPKLIEAREIPIHDTTDMDRITNNIPGMEGLIRLRDLPSILQSRDVNGLFQYLISETLKVSSTITQGLILNTFDDLEHPVLEQMWKEVPCPIYTIGPLNMLLESFDPDYRSTLKSGSGSLWTEDMSCITWLNGQQQGSVIYVSFGSYTQVSRKVLVEFFHGLVESGVPFLWVIRPNLVLDGDADEKDDVPKELRAAVKDRGYLVTWAPQEEVLVHSSVGGFLTHSGWNSTLESICTGVPMLCWPFFADQQINSRFVGHVWKLGLDMKGVNCRYAIGKMVRELMVERREEFRKTTCEMAKLAKGSVDRQVGGSSSLNFQRLLNHIREISLRISEIAVSHESPLE